MFCKNYILFEYCDPDHALEKETVCVEMKK